MIFSLLHRLLPKMSAKSILKPPPSCKNLQKLDLEKFQKEIELYSIEVDTKLVPMMRPILKKYRFKMENMKLLNEQLDTKLSNLRFLLSPEKISNWMDFECSDREKMIALGLDQSKLIGEKIRLEFANFSLSDILKAVLPDAFTLSSFTQIGHLVHINLDDHLVPYRFIIGEIILEKISTCETVVYKRKIINNTFRNFEMEIICGKPETIVDLKTNGLRFRFDFAKVYWNTRLSTEHERIVQQLNEHDILYDCFAGVGPFSIAAATKKHCRVLANDLNPDAILWLRENVRLNKVNADRLTIFNENAADFIRNHLRADWLTNGDGRDGRRTGHIVMNLPSMATEFLTEFRGLFAGQCDKLNPNLVCHCYCFIKDKNKTVYKQLARDCVEEALGYRIADHDLLDCFLVRTVSNFKEMVRVSFKIDFDFLLDERKSCPAPKDESNNDHFAVRKKFCSELNSVHSPHKGYFIFELRSLREAHLVHKLRHLL